MAVVLRVASKWQASEMAGRAWQSPIQVTCAVAEIELPPSVKSDIVGKMAGLFLIRHAQRSALQTMPKEPVVW